MAILIERGIPSSLIEKEREISPLNERERERERERKRKRKRKKYVELSPIER